MIERTVEEFFIAIHEYEAPIEESNIDLMQERDEDWRGHTITEEFKQYLYKHDAVALGVLVGCSRNTIQHIRRNKKISSLMLNKFMEYLDKPKSYFIDFNKPS